MNQQQIEKKVNFKQLDVHSIFHTIQGEGPFSGTAAVFIRLAGCNLRCPQCDTDYTSRRMTMTPDEILEEIQKHVSSGLIVITGGEPFRQNLEPLLKLLTRFNFYVQIETNGTLPCPGLWYSRNITNRSGVYIVVSPKTGSVHPSIDLNACAYKYVISANSVFEYDGLPVKALDHPNDGVVARPEQIVPIYIQPEDSRNEEQNKNNIQATIDSCMKFSYTMQVQMHKIIGVQ